MYEIYENFDQLKLVEPELASELLNEYGAGAWQQEELFVYDTLIDLAQYEVAEGWYGDLDIKHDCNGAPNLLNFIDYEALGNALRETWDGSMYYFSEYGSVVQTSHGWW